MSNENNGNIYLEIEQSAEAMDEGDLAYAGQDAAFEVTVEFPLDVSWRRR